MEDKLRPRVVASLWRRDLLTMAVLVVLAAVLLPPWIADVGPLFGGGDDAQDASLGNVAYYLANIPGQMASFYLLVALGFALALRTGAVDLSVWAVAAGGGVLTAWLLNTGLAVPVAFVAAAVAAALWGAVQGWLVARARLPSVLVTAVGAVALTLVLRAAVGAESLPVVGDRFAALRRHMPIPPMLIGRMLLIACIYSAVLLVMVLLDALPARRPRPDRRRELHWALAVSAALAAVGGACWLIDHPAAPVPTWPVGDLRIVAAALLAGAALLGGGGRTLVVCLALPPALLTVTVWRQEVTLLQWGRLVLGPALLVVQIIVAHVAIHNALSWRQRGKRLAVAALTLLVAGMAVLAGTGRIANPPARQTFLLTALGAWAVGAVLLVVSRWRRRPTWASARGRDSIV